MDPPCGTMDRSQRWLAMQYGWSGWLVNIPIHIEGDSCDGVQIEVTSKQWPKNHSESMREGSRRKIEDGKLNPMMQMASQIVSR